MFFKEGFAYQFFSDVAAEKMKSFGLIRVANVGPEWLRECEPEEADFDRIIALDFCHLLLSHGIPLKNTAKQKLEFWTN